MDIFKELLHAILHQDFKILSDPSLDWLIYLLVFIIIFLENGLLPAAFLPGDSLLILIGMLIAKEALNFIFVLLFLIVAAGFGSWISYMQGRWLKNNRLIKRWLAQLPANYHQRAYRMFHRHGLSSLLIGRFIAFIRTLLPTIAGLSGLSNLRFHFFNWISAFLWVFILTSVGFVLETMPMFQRYEEELIVCMILLPLALLITGMVSSLVLFLYKKRLIKPNKK